MSKELLLLFDTNSVIHRAFHALPPLKMKDGSPGGAVYGTLTTFFRIVDEFTPSMIAVAFDSPGKTFRHDDFAEYKAHRPKCPDELVEQIIKTKEVFERMGFAVLSEAGLEADVIVGTVAKNIGKDKEVVIVTGDMDILQLVDGKVKAYTLKRGIKESVLYGTEEVKERYGGLLPEQLVDVKALQGDSSDNIPGVSGIGEKTAISLIKEFGSLEQVYESLEKGGDFGFSDRIKEKLLKEKSQAFMSKRLATIDTQRFTDFKEKDFVKNFDEEKVVPILEELGFPSLVKRLAKEEKNGKKEEKENLTFEF